MLRIALRETYDEPNPPSRFAVMAIHASIPGADLLGQAVGIDVSVEQAQTIIIDLWRLLPSDARPVPR